MQLTEPDNNIDPDTGTIKTISKKGSMGKMKSLSRVRLFATPWTVAYQAPPSMGFSRQEYWSGVPKVGEKNAWISKKFQQNGKYQKKKFNKK